MLRQPFTLRSYILRFPFRGPLGPLPLQAIYQMDYFVDGVDGIQNAEAAMDGFRACKDRHTHTAVATIRQC